MTDTPRRPDSRRGVRDLAEIFGDVFPDITTDDRPDGVGGIDEEQWYHDNRPPHYERG